MHAAWLDSSVASIFNESVYYPYTSLQYHTLVAAALLHNYRAGHAFADISLVATATNETVRVDETRDADAALAADDVEPHRTVLWTPELTLQLTATPGDRPAARLGNRPARSFADTWSRLPAHPLNMDGQQRCRVLDAQLRRIRSWSVALAYIDEYVTAHATSGGDGT